MKNKEFVHLHVMSEYSIGKGVIQIPRLIQRAKETGMKSVALTDTGVLHGMVKFYEEASKSGIKPIIGCEIYIKDNENTNLALEGSILLLAENNDGLKNLIRLSSIQNSVAGLCVTISDLKSCHKGLIALSGGNGGVFPNMIKKSMFPKLIKKYDPKFIQKQAMQFKKIFGEDNFFFELINHGLKADNILNSVVVEISSELSIPIVATNEVKYLHPEDEPLYLIRNEKRIPVETDLSTVKGEAYLKSNEEMASLFQNMPNALFASVDISNRCNVDLKIGEIRLPKFQIAEDKTSDDYLFHLTMKGLERKYGALNEKIKDRANFELEIIQKNGVSDYFLIVWDIIQFAKGKNIAVGPGRGSVSGSIVAYALDITQVDPLKYGLIFERFINPLDTKIPDVDTDFCLDGRDEVIKYLKTQYGSNKTAGIITFGRLKARNAIRTLGRLLKHDEETIEIIAELIPFFIPDKKVTINSSIEHVEELKKLRVASQRIRDLFNLSSRMENIAWSTSQHAAGILISNAPLTDCIPVIKLKEHDSNVSQFDVDDIEGLGFLRLDILGLNSLNVIQKTLEIINERHDLNIDINNIPLDDDKTFDMLRKLETDGLFQCEGNSFKELIYRVQPTAFEDLVAITALNRPGPLDEGFVEQFIESKENPEKTEYMHTSLKKELNSTGGIMIYQEQLIRILHEISGLSLGECDRFRKLLFRKNTSEEDTKLFDQLKSRIIGNAVKKTKNAREAEEIVHYIEKFGGYAFLKAHSVSYTLIGYQMGYLKAHYPMEFMAALLNVTTSNTDRLEKYIDVCKEMKIEVVGPDINHCDMEFKIEGGKIHYGLNAVPYLVCYDPVEDHFDLDELDEVDKEATELQEFLQSLAREREKNGLYKNIQDVLERMKTATGQEKDMLKDLVQHGIFDSLEGNWKYKHLEIERFFRKH